MKVIDPGHVYELDELDGSAMEHRAHGSPEPLCFVKREGDLYPGNVGTHPGVTTQEVLQVLIDRTLYVDRQIPHPANTTVLGHLRGALLALEERAAERRGETLGVVRGLRHRLLPESIPTCAICGHIYCSKHDV